MHICAADRRLLNLDENIVDPILRYRDFAQRQSRSGFFLDQCFHVLQSPLPEKRKDEKNG